MTKRSWPVKAILLLALLALSLPALQQQQAIPVAGRKQLFIDRKFIESSEGITLTMNPPHPTGEKLVVLDQPWEVGHRLGSYCTILKEDGPDGTRFRLWYDVYTGMGVPGNGYRAVAYAESADGIRFRKPVLGLVEKDGSKRNNYVLPTDLSAMTVGGGSVYRDDNPNCPPGERYKSWTKLYARKGTIPGGNRVWHSPDGLRWKLYGTPATGLRASDTQPSWFWDPRIGRYRGYSREAINLTPNRSIRSVGYNESDDMLHWEGFRIVMRPDSRDLAAVPVQNWHSESYKMAGEAIQPVIPEWEPELQPASPMDFYAPGVFPYSEAPDVYLATIPVYHHWRSDGKQSWPDTIDVQLAASRDGLHFERLGKRQPFLRLGPAGSFSSRSVWVLPRPVRVGDELWVYYRGGNLTHGYQLDPQSREPQSAISRAIMRLDGFVSADADYEGGWIITPPITFEGSRLELNLDTSAGGAAQVEILDPAGKPIPGFTLADADELNGNSVRMLATWRGSQDVSRLAGTPIKLHIRLRSSRLYAFQFPRT